MSDLATRDILRWARANLLDMHDPWKHRRARDDQSMLIRKLIETVERLDAAHEGTSE